MTAEGRPPAGAVDVILRDGGTLRLRPPVAADAQALLDFFAGLSGESRYLRFHGFRPVDTTLVEPFLDPDWVSRGALIGSLADESGTERVLAVASYARLTDPDTAEMAFAVADDEQQRGIGTRLLEQLARRAREAGIGRFVAEVVSTNAAALTVFGNVGFELVRELEGDEIELRFPIASTATLLDRVGDRDHNAVVASLRPFFEPSSIAVIGASPRRGSIGGELFRNLIEGNFDGAVYPINRQGTPVTGVRGYRSLGEIGGPVDLAVFCVPAEQVLPAASEALRAGVRALCVVSAGFSETGEEGRARQERLLALARAHGARLVGPNCLGIAVPPRGVNATFASRALPSGRIGFSSQSGALGLALLEKAAERSLGFSSFVSIGNKADVSSNDLLEWWEDDPSTDLALLYLESFGNPRTFARVARRVAQKKPILALKAGATEAGSRAARSHTAALASSDAAVDALFHRAGVVRARTLEELLDAAALLSSQPLPRGRRVGVITNAGGLGILCADACGKLGLELPALTAETREQLAAVLPAEASVANPIDLLGSATAETYAAALPPVLADPDIDAVIVIFVPPVVAAADDVAAAIRDALLQPAATKPVVAVLVTEASTPAAILGEGSPVVAIPYPESAARALAFACERAEWLARPAGTTPRLDGIDLPAARAIVEVELETAADGWLPPAAVRRLLGAYGIPLIPERLADDPDGAVAATRELGLPAVVKTAVAGAHKTEVGGVALDLRDEREVREAAGRIGGPVLVQPFLRGGVELLVGIVQDPVFGPLVAVGPGGTNAELIGGASFGLAPLNDLDAVEMLSEGKVGRLVRGFRGTPPANIEALTDLVLRLGKLAEDLPDVAELDLNPVLAGPEGCVAVDARVRVRAHSRERRLKSW